MATQRPMLGRATVQQVAGIVSDLLMKLGNDRDGLKLLERVKLLLRNEPPKAEEVEPIPDWRVWRTVLVGGRPWMRLLLWRIKSGNCLVEKDAHSLLLSKAFASNRDDRPDQWPIHLVKITPNDLGIKTPSGKEYAGVPVAEVVLRALAQGLDFCPTDVVPQLCLKETYPQHLDGWLDSPYLVIMTKPLPLSDGGYGLFRLRPTSGHPLRHPILGVRGFSCQYTNLIGGPYTIRRPGSLQVAHDTGEFVFLLRRPAPSSPPLIHPAGIHNQ